MSNNILAYPLEETIVDSTSANIVTNDNEQFVYHSINSYRVVSCFIEESIDDSNNSPIADNDDEQFVYATPNTRQKEVLLTYKEDI